MVLWRNKKLFNHCSVNTAIVFLRLSHTQGCKKSQKRATFVLAAMSMKRQKIAVSIISSFSAGWVVEGGAGRRDEK